MQALGNFHIDVKDLDVDFASFSAHKIYGPKGVGALYKRKGIIIPNFIHGGAQERKKRAGTENTSGIVGFGAAAELAGENMAAHGEHCSRLRNLLWEKIQERIPDVDLNGRVISPEDIRGI